MCTLKLVTSWPGLVLAIAHTMIYVAEVIVVEGGQHLIVFWCTTILCLIQQSMAAKKAMETLKHYQSPVRSFLKCSLHWQSEAEQGGSRRDGQECVETDRERSVLFVQVCVCVCELHPPRLRVTWRDRNVVPVKAFFKVRKHTGTSNKHEIFSATDSALFSFYRRAPLPDFFNAVPVDLFPHLCSI